MDTARLQIEQQRAQIQIDIQQAQLHVESEPRRMVVHREPPEMIVHREEGEVRLDMEDFKSRIGLKTYDEWNKDAAAEAHAKTLQSIREQVNEAAYVADVSLSGQNRIANLIKENMLEPKDPSLNIGPVPAEIDMEGDPGKMKIEWSDSELSIEWEGGGPPQVYLDPPHSIDIYMEERPYVSVSVVRENGPKPSGRNIDTTV
jgi:hypothetical protein